MFNRYTPARKLVSGPAGKLTANPTILRKKGVRSAAVPLGGLPPTRQLYILFTFIFRMLLYVKLIPKPLRKIRGIVANAF